jgi:hypothetical protein
MVMTSSDHLVFDRDPDRKVAHGVDEDQPGSPPAQWHRQGLGVGGDAEPGPRGAGVAVGLVVGLAHGLQALGQSQGVAAVTGG